MNFKRYDLGFVLTVDQANKIERARKLTGRPVKDCISALVSEEWGVADAVMDLRNDGKNPTAKTHTVPNSITVQVILAAGQHPKHMAVVRRDGQVLALYPAEWNRNRIPTLREVQRDFRWQKPQP
jgi:hypothetical protein